MTDARDIFVYVLRDNIEYVKIIEKMSNLKKQKVISGEETKKQGE
jgi:hypothetical protein